MRFAFSTVACPDWTIERVVRACVEYGYAGVEMRSFGAGGTELACEPALTDGSKIQRLCDDAGVMVAGIATGARFDARVWPPVIGHLSAKKEASVQEGRHLVDVAVACQARYVRVYGFEIAKGERRQRAVRRIVERLGRVVDHAQNRDLEVVLENGGSFSRAEELAEIIDAVGSPLLGACYDVQAAHAAGEDVLGGVALLGAMLRVARVRDRKGGIPCVIGDGELGCEGMVRALGSRSGVWVVFSWDRLWRPELASADEVLPQAAERLATWASAGAASGAAA